MINGKKYVLSFCDDFEGKDLDLNKWKYCEEQHRQDTDCYWRNDSLYLDGRSNLVIVADLDKDGTHKCGAIETKGIFEQTYGYYECKFKVEKKNGYWSAFWLWAPSVLNETGGSVNGCEIDIFEHVASERFYACNLHWNGYGKNHRTVGNTYYIDDKFYEEYHVAGFEWTEDLYSFYLDGKLIYSTVAEGICTEPLYILLSSEFGSWGGIPEDEKLPGLFIIDYVKAFRLDK